MATVTGDDVIYNCAIVHALYCGSIADYGSTLLEMTLPQSAWSLLMEQKLKDTKLVPFLAPDHDP